MLIRYKKNHEKMAMGLLAFMPDEKDVRVLQETMKKYEEDENWHLYLWKEDEDIVGVIGCSIENDINVVVQHISVNPSHRNIGIGKKMLDEIFQQYNEKYDVCPNKYTEHFFEGRIQKEQNDETLD